MLLDIVMFAGKKTPLRIPLTCPKDRLRLTVRLHDEDNTALGKKIYETELKSVFCYQVV